MKFRIENFVLCILGTCFIFSVNSEFQNIIKESRVSEFLTIPEFRYHSSWELEYKLQELALSFPNISRLYSIGKSVSGRKLYVLEISDNPGVHEPGEPEFRYVANMHGDETVGREIVLVLAHYLLEGFNRIPRVTRLINDTRIHLMPTMNPDGFELSTRKNVQGIDLNRDFPDIFIKNSPRAPETRAVIKWSKSVPFVLSASFHGGALVVVYPYATNRQRISTYSPTVDENQFLYLSMAYSLSHPEIPRRHRCRRFPDGISNGAEWYSIHGGMEDWVYQNTNCFQILVEVSCVKDPAPRTLRSYWLKNREAMMVFIEQIHIGIKGFVRGENELPIKGAVIQVHGAGKVVTTAEDGDYWRPLIPGDYQVSAKAKGYITETKFVTIKIGEKATQVDFYLSSGKSREPPMSPYYDVIIQTRQKEFLKKFKKDFWILNSIRMLREWKSGDEVNFPFENKIIN